ncbi:MAG: YraN family protein [Desulfobacterales bacterium CG23_combo_of_CG06-09_8_20_14_all_51_8]|nr:MAG: YraN family protein [Desulfobacterales bacterium CG23_combo_of_CG06-09_8_20_14_all_51_8]
MLNLRQKFGKFGEDLAARFLKKQGYEIICKNFHCCFGEIDIIAKDKDTVVFVEVKSRRTSTFGHPKFAVTKAKQEKISKVALHYLKINDQSNSRARFDVVTVNEVAATKTDIEIIKNAFELAYK